LIRLPGMTAPIQILRWVMAAAMVATSMSAIDLVRPAKAQRVQSIAAIVNDDIVSMFDLQSRLQLVVASTGIKVTPRLRKRLIQQVLRLLIDERLQIQEAKRRNITATKRDMSQAFTKLEKQNKLKPGMFESFIRRNNLPRKALIGQLRAQITWQKLIRRTLTRRVSVGQEEIDEDLARLKARRGQSEYRVAEIVLAVNTPEQEQGVIRTAQQLIEQLRKDAQFSAVAQQMSRSASASTGGDLGWIAETVLDHDLAQIVPKMKKGEIAGPIKSPSGVRILLLSDTRRVLLSSATDAIVDLRRITLSLAPKADANAVTSQLDILRIMGETISGCEDFERAAKEAASAAPINLGKRRLGNLSQSIRNAVTELAIGKTSKPLRHKSGVSIYMVCARDDATANLPTREAIERRIFSDRVSNLARQYMRDLRNAAVVDLRT
jgi:peptidyl-prolyl cis-trans isomerase SurA